MYFYIWLYCALYKFLEVQIMHTGIIGKKGCRFQLCHQVLAVFLLGQDVVMSQKSLYIELDCHSWITTSYHGYQYRRMQGKVQLHDLITTCLHAGTDLLTSQMAQKEKNRNGMFQTTMLF